MSAEEFREDVDRALQTAVAGDADLDKIEAVLEEAQGRVDELRVLRGEA